MQNMVEISLNERQLYDFELITDSAFAPLTSDEVECIELFTVISQHYYL